MSITRRSAIGMLAGSIPAVRLASAQVADRGIQKGPFRGTRGSLRAYQVPHWLRGGKFGIVARSAAHSPPPQRKVTLMRGLKCGVRDHLWMSNKCFGTSHDSDKAGEYAGVPYDGNDAKYVDLYHDLPKDYPAKFSWDAEGIPDSWKRHWFDRIKDLVDNYQPDLLYTDGALPFEEYGLSLVAHLYNENAKRHGGSVEPVYTSKRKQT